MSTQADAGKSLSGATGVSSTVDNWAGCLATPVSIELLASKGMSFDKLVVLSRTFPDPVGFHKAVNDLAGQEADQVSALDLYMVQDFLKGCAADVAAASPSTQAYSPQASQVAQAQAGSATPASVPSSQAPHHLLSPSSAVSGSEARETIEGTSECIRNANLLGVTTLTVLTAHANGDEAARQATIGKAIAKRATDGGVVLKAIRASEEKFMEHIEELCQWLADAENPLMFAVARIRVCVNQAPPWKAGGKEYWDKYMTRYTYVFPVRFDQLLHQNAHNKALAGLVKNLGDLGRIDEAMVQMDDLSMHLASMEQGDVCANLNSLTLKGKCVKCLEDGHSVKDCPYPSDVAVKIRAAFCNGHKSAKHKKN